MESPANKAAYSWLLLPAGNNEKAATGGFNASMVLDGTRNQGSTHVQIHRNITFEGGYRLQRNDNDLEVMANRSIMFVHVGKSGGETIKRVLEIACRTKANKDAFLFSLRHPLDRTLSWFRNFDPQNCPEGKRTKASCLTAHSIKNDPTSWAGHFFGVCFSSAEAWAQALSHPKDKCNVLAWDTILGRIAIQDESLVAHMTANIRRYAKATAARYPEKDVLVVRMEYMWKDLKALDLSLGGTGRFGAMAGSKVAHGSEVYEFQNEDLSAASVVTMCCALRDEMEVFYSLLHKAQNLDAVHKRRTWEDALSYCGSTSWIDFEAQCRTIQQSFH
ncbi:predicted protein [Phaeodactylum tricornutum CCAP 1055/1]|uniref:Uncharacterized protein n=2 Tax=Phaeodactylum tricornutum TaxID=2850 RepID=B7G882_PHATC|nr:predicted protein [Phaeodactylum tricornutum CCAP 1055/1]EEC44997.1 predicted protein [Phaeodactylum tricornutum CCAP 1055/1]|eukprot:XP_002183297.1 predicted protein [Phaeodactylum tricornutum CCAP 1055/1]